MITRIHVNQFHIRNYTKTGSSEPVFRCKTYMSNDYAHVVHIVGPCKIIYSPDKPLACGARVWIETNSEVKIAR